MSRASSQGLVAQFPKLTFQFKTNNNALCLAWMSAAAKGRRYLLFLCQWKSSFIFLLKGPHSLRSASQPWLHCTGMPGWTARASRCLYKSQELQTHTHTHSTHTRIHTYTETLVSCSAGGWWLSSLAKNYLRCWKKHTLCSSESFTYCNIMWVDYLYVDFPSTGGPCDALSATNSV